MTRTEVRGIADDPALPGASGLFGAPGRRAVAAFLDRRGWKMDELRPVQALYRPGRECVVRYRVRATESGGGRRVLSVSAESRARRRDPIPPHPALGDRYSLAEPVEECGPGLVWAFPYDPSIGALPDAAWGPALREGLAPRPLGVSVQPLRYRPRRRAVFRYRALYGGGTVEVLYGKALRPSRRRRALEVAGSLRPRRGLPLARPEEMGGTDVLVTRSLPGVPLRRLLLSGGSLPAPARVAVLPERIVRLADAGDAERVADPVAVAAGTARLIETLVPDAGRAARRVAEWVASGAASAPRQTAFVHGDLYEDQVLVGPGFSLGVVDLDDAGPGDPLDDAANFCAHLVALALAAPRAGRRILAYRSLVRAAFGERLGAGPADIAWREGLAMLRLATGPFRVLMPGWPREVGRRVNLALRLASGS